MAQLHLLFVRHGETQDNIDKVLQGHRDTSLTTKGLGEADVLAQNLQGQHIDVIYRSPLIRIEQTVDPILKQRPGLPVHIDGDLKGQGLGDLEGASYDSVNFGNPRDADKKPGVERFDDFVGRLKVALGRIIGAEAPLVKGSSRVVLIGTHGVAITALFQAMEAKEPCEGFNEKLATRGPGAYEVRWTDSDDVAEIIVLRPGELQITDSALDWDKLSGQPLLIERWGKREKEIDPDYYKYN